MRFHGNAVHSIITEAVERRVIPCAAYAVGQGKEIFCQNTLGYRSLFPAEEPVREDTHFDMASLSKVLATTSVALRFLEEGRWRQGGERSSV